MDWQAGFELEVLFWHRAAVGDNDSSSDGDGAEAAASDDNNFLADFADIENGPYFDDGSDAPRVEQLSEHGTEHS